MTLAQLELFSTAGGKHHRVQLQEAIISSLAGARYDEESLRKLLRSLEK